MAAETPDVGVRYHLCSRGIVAFALSAPAARAVGPARVHRRRPRSPFPNSTSRLIRIRRRSSWRSPPNPPANPPRRWSATTRSRSRSGLPRRPASTSSARPRFMASHSFACLSIRRRLLFRAAADRHQSAAERQSAEQRHAADPGHEPGRRDLPLSGGRTSAFRIDQSAHRSGLGIAAAPADGARRGAAEHLGRDHEGI